MKKAYLIFSSLISACVLSCTSIDPEVIENKVYFDRLSAERVVELPVSIHDSYVKPLSARVAVKAATDMRISFKADRKLVDEYNSFYGEDAVMLPSDNYFFDYTRGTISAGTVYCPENNISFEGLLDLDLSKVYVLPVTVSCGENTITDRAVIYYVFRRAGIVSVVGNFNNNNTGVRARVAFNDYSALTKTDRGFTYEALMYCTFTNDGLPFDPSRNNYPEGHSDMYIMTLMGATGTTNAIHIRYYLNARSDGGAYWFELTNFNRKSWSVEGEHPTSQSREDQFKFYPDRKWFHFCVTFDKASRDVCWYCDGKLVSTRKSPSTNFALISDDSIENWHIGTADTWWWAGKLSEIRVWNRALTAEEINSDNHFYYVDPEKVEGLACYWKINEGTGGTFYDYSGYGNHATVISESPILWEKVDLPEMEPVEEE